MKEIGKIDFYAISGFQIILECNMERMFIDTMHTHISRFATILPKNFICNDILNLIKDRHNMRIKRVLETSQIGKISSIIRYKYTLYDMKTNQ